MPIETITDYSTTTIRSIVEREFGTSSVMVDIARCESGFRQFDESGEPLRGHLNSQDIGVFQINEKYHLEASKRLTIDIYSLDGNIAYGRHLYESQGTRPWNWSKDCWGS